MIDLHPLWDRDMELEKNIKDFNQSKEAFLIDFKDY